MLNEKHHALIVLGFFNELKNFFGGKGITVFKKATQIYGEERGKRMSLRAIRDGYELTYPVYFAYSEWMATDEWFNIEDKAKEGSITCKCWKCPWNTVFGENDMLECGPYYCEEIDRAIVRGFNPNLNFEIKSMQHNSDCCRLYFLDNKIDENFFHESGKIKNKIGNENIMDFGYHCSHIYNTFSKVIIDTEIDKVKASRIINNVKAFFISKYSSGIFEEILKYGKEDFNYLPKWVNGKKY